MRGMGFELKLGAQKTQLLFTKERASIILVHRGNVLHLHRSIWARLLERMASALVPEEQGELEDVEMGEEEEKRGNGPSRLRRLHEQTASQLAIFQLSRKFSLHGL